MYVNIFGEEKVLFKCEETRSIFVLQYDLNVSNLSDFPTTAVKVSSSDNIVTVMQDYMAA